MNSNLTAAIADLTKRFGEGTVMQLGGGNTEEIEVFSTKVPSIDLALGVKGLPRGRVTEIYGAESSGKTTLALQVVASAQAKGVTCAYIDVEHALDPVYAEKLGVNIQDMLISQPASAEEVLEVAEALVKTGEVGVVVIDSVAAMVPQAEINGEFGDAQMGLMARLMSQAMRKLTAPISDNNVCFIFINQTRSKIGVMWGSPTTTTGGNALKFYASMRLEVNRIGAVKDGEEIIGNRTKIKIVKNKLAAPFKEVETSLIYGEGIPRELDLLELAIEKGIIKKKGSWLSYNDENLGQGTNKVSNFLKENPTLLAEIEQKIYNPVD